MGGSAGASSPTRTAPCGEEGPRLDSLICWYEREARKANVGHKSARISSIVAAAAIPVLTAANADPVASAVLGGAVVALEAVQELFQFQRNWVSFGSTKEALKRERALFEALAGPYRRSLTKDPERVLAERIE